MLMSTLNTPFSLLVSAGIAVGIAYHSSDLPLRTLKVVNLLSFAINLVSVSWPGRLDGELAKAMQDEKATGLLVENTVTPINILGGRTLIAPAAWAFAIWGPIYILEAASMVYVALLPKDSPLVPILQRTTPFWFLACASQALWCCSFRRKFVIGSLMAQMCAPFFLGMTSLSLSKVQAIASASCGQLTSRDYAAAFCGMTLHFAWTAAATLVNLNGALAYAEVSLSMQKWAGVSSVAAAVALAGIVACGGGGGTVAFVLAWALKACAAGMAQRLQGQSGNLSGAQAVETLSNVGAVACVMFGCWALVGGRVGDYWGRRWGAEA